MICHDCHAEAETRPWRTDDDERDLCPACRLRARNEFVCANSGLVGNAVHKLRPHQLARLGGWEDACQEGLAKLVQIVDSGCFDPSRSRFSSYATTSLIRHLVGVSSESALVRVPRHALSGPYSAEAAAAHASPLRFSNPYDSEADVIDWPGREKEPWEDLAAEDDATIVSALMGSLPDRIRDVVERIYLRGETGEDVRAALKIDRSRVYQLRDRGIALMRRAVGAEV